MKEVLITSSILIAVLLLLRWLLRGKVSQRLIYAAWLLVALRLLIPVQIGQASFSLLTAAQPVTQAVEQVADRQVAGVSRQEAFHDVLQDCVENDADVFTPQVQEYIQIFVDNKIPAEQIVEDLEKHYSDQELFRAEYQSQVQQQIEDTAATVTFGQILTWVWLAGVAIMALWFVTANLIFLRRAKKHAVEAEFEGVRVRISPNVPTPCVVGLLRPVIYLTPAVAENEQGRAHVLAHELAHLRHGDHIWALIRCLCLCIYWFDPLVWIAAAQSQRDCELACDESALKKLGDGERIAYGKTLLDIVSQSVSPAHLLHTATAMNESKRQLTERVRFIAKKPRNILIAAICLILVAAITAGCAFLGASAADTGNGRPGYKMVYLLMEQTNYSPDGEISEKYQYSYDNNGLLVDWIYTDFAKPERSEDYHYTYDSHGVSNSSCVFDEDGKLLSYASGYYQFEYDEEGRLTQYATEADSVQQRDTKYIHFMYNADGRLYKIYTDTGSTTPVVEDSVFTYDEQGRLIHSSADQTSYVYDEDGNLVQTISRGNPMRNFKYTYENGVLIGIEHCVDREEDKETYEMDGKGNVECVIWADGSRAKFRYVAAELPVEFANRILRDRHVSGMASTVDAYCDDIAIYFWPYPKPHRTSIGILGTKY